MLLLYVRFTDHHPRHCHYYHDEHVASFITAIKIKWADITVRLN